MTDYAPTIMASAAFLTALAGLVRSFLNAAAIAKNTTTTQAIDKKTEVVAAHVNSQKTADMAKIESLQKQVSDLLVLLAEKKETAALLAQSAAISAMAGAGPSLPAEVKVINPPDEPVPTTSSVAPKAMLPSER